jgi:hypothetical protein
VRNLVGKSKNEADAGVAIGWVDVEDVAADAFGFRRFMEKAVTLGPGERDLDALRGDGLEGEHAMTSWSVSP